MGSVIPMKGERQKILLLEHALSNIKAIKENQG